MEPKIIIAISLISMLVVLYLIFPTLSLLKGKKGKRYRVKEKISGGHSMWESSYFGWFGWEKLNVDGSLAESYEKTEFTHKKTAMNIIQRHKDKIQDKIDTIAKEKSTNNEYFN